MRLRAPAGTTHVQTPAQVYDLTDGYIDVKDNSDDAAFFLSNGFQPITYIPETTETVSVFDQTTQEEQNGIL